MEIREVRVGGWASGDWRSQVLVQVTDLSNDEVEIESGARQWVLSSRVDGSMVSLDVSVPVRSLGYTMWRWEHLSWRQRHHLYELDGGQGYLLVRVAFGGACDRPAVHVIHLSREELLVYLGVAFGHVAGLWKLPTETVSEGASRLGLSEVVGVEGE